MREGPGRALIASAFPEETERLRGLLREIGFSGIECVGDGASALRRVQGGRFDALLADAVLPRVDGVELFRRIQGAPLTVYPAVILMKHAGMGLRRGAEGCAALDKPATREALIDALARMRPERRPAPEEKRARAEQALTSVGVPEHCGRDYLRSAILMAWQDVRLLHALTTRLYPAVAEQYGVDVRHVERAMRHVIDVAWRSGEIEAQYDLFGDTIDARRGSPTCGEMIAQIADILRWEGRA